MSNRKIKISLVSSFLTLAQLQGAVLFEPGDLYFATNQAPTRIYDLTGGGDFSGAAPFATAGAAGNASLGQMAWTHDHSTMYSTNYNGNTIYTVDGDGVASFYANAPNPLGVVVTAGGQVLVNEFSNQRIMDYTNPGAPTVFATLPTFSRNIRQLRTGEILVAGGNGQIYDVSGGTATVYATIAGSGSSYLGDIDYTSDGRVFVTGGFGQEGKIYEITGGGLIPDVPFATITNGNNGSAFGLAIHPITNQMLVAPLSQDFVLDITGGGVIDATDPSNYMASNIPSTSDMALDFVPIFVPEPSSALLSLLGVFVCLSKRRR